MNIFRFALPLALTFILSTDVFADDEEFAPRNGFGTITIITDPPNSDVFLDGDSLGKSPITKRKFRSGPLKLIIMDQGRELINTRFNVWPNKDNKYEGKTVMPQGTIKVTTTPSSCRIYVDGEYLDRTEGGLLTLTAVGAGSHTIGAECAGTRLFEELIEVRGEEVTEIHLDAKKRRATLK